MKAKFKAEKPESVTFNLEISMTIAEWDAVSTQLESAYPAWQFSNMIKTVVSKAKSTYYAEDNEVTPYDA